MSATDPFRAELERASAELQAGRPAAAEPIYRAVLARAPEHGVAMHFLGLALVQTGRLHEGLELMGRSMGTLGGVARFRYNYAVMLGEAGDLEGAERELGTASAADPRNAAILEHLGVVRQSRGRVDEAVAAYRAAAALGPPSAQLLNNLGSALSDAGDVQGAVESFRRAVSRDGRHALAWFNLAVALRRQGDEAGALDALRGAVRADPHAALAWQQLVQMHAGVRFDRWDPQAAALLVQALAQPNVDLQPMAAAAAGLIMLDPELAPAFDAVMRGDAAAPLSADVMQRIARPMLLGVLEHTLVIDTSLEAVLSAVRRALLLAWREGRLEPSPALAALLAALAQQCFQNEYLWAETPAEASVLEALEAEVRERGASDAAALLGCYRPLGRLDGFRPSAGPGGPYARLWQQQIGNVIEERRLRDALRQLTPIDDETSRAVQSQYEANPYPRWHRLSATHAVPYPVRQAVHALFPHVEPARLAVPDAPEMLIAGCGTGFQAAVAAARNPRARILAVDLSASSLAYAQRRCHELGLANVEFAQADLLRLGTLERRFHVVECVGVLHHLREPLAGWRVLRGLLTPRGVMKVGLYSDSARRGVVTARELARGHGLGTDLASVREIRRLVRAEPASSPARALLDAVDFHSASGARDLMLHVEEHRFTIPQLAAALDSLALEFLGFELDEPAVFAAYRERFPEDLQAASLARWERFEADHPHVFAGMYQFWAAAHG